MAVKCPRCGRTMQVKTRRYHKQCKWVCPRCGKVRMTRPANRTPPPDRHTER